MFLFDTLYLCEENGLEQDLLSGDSHPKRLDFLLDLLQNTSGSFENLDDENCVGFWVNFP